MLIRVLALAAVLLSAAVPWQAFGADFHVRVLAASCAACHGTHGNSVGGTPVLAGQDRAQFIAKMQAFRSGAQPATIMHRHASGLTEEEIRQLADHFASQARRTNVAPEPLNENW